MIIIMVLRGGPRLSSILNNVSPRFRLKTCSHPFQCINYGKFVRESDGDVFGNLSRSREIVEPPDDTEEVTEYEAKPVPESRIIKKLRNVPRNHEYYGLLEAYRDVVKSQKPSEYTYRLLIKHLADLHKAEDAYSLFQDVRRMKSEKVNPAIYTSLFKACENCENSELALKISNQVFKHLKKYCGKISLTHYRAYMLVLAKHSDCNSTFSYMDYLEKKGIRDVYLYNTLLLSCCSNKEYGLRLAVLVYHLMVARKHTPDSFTFMVLAKCVRNCSFGDIRTVPSFIESVFQSCSIKSLNELAMEKTSSTSGTYEGLESDDDVPVETYGVTDFDHDEKDLTLDGSSGNDEITGIASQPINILKPRPIKGLHIDYDSLSDYRNRFMMFGGLSGFLEVMSDFKVSPNVKVFTALLDCLPSDCKEEEKLYEEMKKFNVETDIPILNNILLRMVQRREFETFEKYIEFSNKYIKQPDVVTIGSLAHGCYKKSEVLQCVEYARSHRLRVPVMVFKQFLRNLGTDKRTLSFLSKIARDEQVNIQGIISNALAMEKSSSRNEGSENLK